jgi:hypothetical protein
MRHDDENQIRDTGGGLLGAPPPRPGNGTPPGLVTHIPPILVHEHDDDSSHHHPPISKMEFPKFDGDLTPVGGGINVNCISRSMNSKLR